MGVTDVMLGWVGLDRDDRGRRPDTLDTVHVPWILYPMGGGGGGLANRCHRSYVPMCLLLCLAWDLLELQAFRNNDVLYCRTYNVTWRSRRTGCFITVPFNIWNVLLRDLFFITFTFCAGTFCSCIN
jgi:hypothetical protein